MILLLTGCINPAGMSYTTLINPEERKKQYVDAIHFYLSKTNYPIVFSENSGIDISYCFHDDIKSGRLEVLCFHGNQDKTRGKGYGECEIIQYALDNSQIIRKRKDQRIAKITGRLIIKNIKRIICLHSLLFPKQTTICAINSGLTFPDRRFILAPKQFYLTFLNYKDNINDSKGYYFEHALCDTIKQETKYSFTPFLIMPQIEGISGSTGEVYKSKKADYIFLLRYLKYTWTLRKNFYKNYR